MHHLHHCELPALTRAFKIAMAFTAAIWVGLDKFVHQLFQSLILLVAQLGYF
jgi:hypothetical protein